MYSLALEMVLDCWPGQWQDRAKNREEKLR